MQVDWLIVGAGLTGCTFAERIANELDQTVLVVERRRHVAGNAFDHFDAHGVLVHRYGPHIFHTRSRAVFDYLSRFTAWIPYYHRVQAVVEGESVPVPFNLNALHRLWPAESAARVERALIEQYGFGRKVPILELRKSPHTELRSLAEYVYEKVFLGYTQKQWGCSPEELDASVSARVPVHISRDDRYFQDEFQGLPRLGYTAMCQRMLDHPRVRLMLGTPFEEVRDQIRPRRLIYTGMIDAFFGHRFGALPYRSLRFDFRHEPVELKQPVAQVNYPSEHTFTRISEFKHMTAQRCAGTTLAVEHPEAYVAGVNEPYYPIPRAENQALLGRYRAAADALGQGTLFAGRLADYRYYNMDQAVARALALFEKRIAPSASRTRPIPARHGGAWRSVAMP